MSRATGIHLSDDILRLISLERVPSGYRLCALLEGRLSVPVRSAALRQPDARNRLARSIKEILGDLESDLGRVAVSLGGGLFQIQKVPLEVASEEDRKRQITWEVSQALISPPEDYHVDFYPAGRAAFWVAIRRQVIDSCTDLYTAAGISPEGFTVEPIALFHACEMARLWAPEPNAAILLAYPWLSFVAADEGLLMAAETVRVPSIPPDGEPPAKSGGGLPDLQDVSERVRRWVYGDRTSDRRRTAYQQVYFCGDHQHTLHLIRHLRPPRSPELIPLQPFSALDTQDLPEAQRPLLSQPGAFGVAAGLAYRELEKTVRGKRAEGRGERQV